MSTSSMLKAKGLNTFNNFLSGVPEGSLLEAENVIIDRDGVIESRRGIKVLADIPSVSKQLLTYKDTVLAHYGDALAYYNGSSFTTFKKKSDFQISDVDVTNNTIQILVHGLTDGDPIVFSSTGSLPAPLVSGTTYYVLNPDQNTFQLKVASTGVTPINITTTGSGVHTATYDYVVNSLTTEQRIKGIELNGNFYVTTSNGIKKISNLSQFAVTNAGGIKALDVDLKIDFNNSSGFLNPSNEVAYRIVWSLTDVNNNLILGTPSYRSVIVNPSSYESRNVTITFPVPYGITTDYSYRIYRTAQTANIGGSGDEHNLVYEAQVTGAEIISSVVTVTDEQPEELRDSGVPLYTNEQTGEGILQSNDMPPIAKDIALYKNTAFFADTTTIFKNTINLLGQDGLTHLIPGSISSVTFSSGETTFNIPDGHGITENQDIVLQGTTVSGKDGVFSATFINSTQFKLTGDFSTIDISKTSIFTSYITITKNSLSNKYYFVGRREINNITFTGSGAGIAGTYFEVYSADNVIPYYVWFNDTTATTTDPSLTGKVGIKVDYTPTDTTHDIVTAMVTSLNSTGDFDCDNSLGDWNASTNTPTLVDGTGIKGQIYRVSVSGSQDFGSGSISFDAEDFVVYNGTIWSKSTYSDNLIIQTINSGFSTDLSFGPSFSYDSSATYKVQDGFGQDVSNNFIRLSTLISPAARIEDTAKSMVFVINNNENDVVNSYYISTLNDLPGSMLFEAKLMDSNPFVIQSNNSTTGSMFNPSISSGSTALNEQFPNRIYYSKMSQPEAVPFTNNIDIGPKDKKILRIIGLRDSLFILKEEGVYRLTGDNSSNFSVTLFDNSSNLVAPDTAAVLNNQIYALTTQGIVSITETGVGIISRPIENIFSRVTSSNYSNSKTASFAFGYEADRAYIIFTVDKTSDTYATKAYRYNTFTNCWTSWKKSATCGIVETKDNKLYCGAADIASIEVERKQLTTRDYADRQYNRSFTLYSLGMILDDVSNIVKGDVIEQVQYLTPSDYNRLVKKGKQDPYLAFPSTLSEITQTGTNLRLSMESLVDQLNSSDLSLYSGTFDGNLDVNIVTNTITITGHGLENNDVVKFSGSSLPAPLVSGTYYAVINKTSNTIQLSETIGGSILDITALGSGVVTVNELYLYSNVEDFDVHQADFNYNITKLNASTGAFFSDYKSSSGTISVNDAVSSINRSFSKIQTVYQPIMFQGPLIHYKAIPTSVVWSPISLGDPSLLKHIRMGTFLLENNTLIGATVGYASDLSGNFEDESIGINQDGNWGEGIWSEFAWGGDGTSVPIRVLIPRQKQRCRYIKARFKHANALNRFAILGISYTYEPGSERAYR